MRSTTYSELSGMTSLFPAPLRSAIEGICSSAEVATACQVHQGSPGARALDAFLEVQLAARGYASQRNARVVRDARFDFDLLITERDWRTAVLIEGGKAARIDLDLLKFIAYGSASRGPTPGYAALVVSDKELPRTITGTTGERAFDYARRLRPLFLGAESNIADLLVVEFSTTG